MPIERMEEEFLKLGMQYYIAGKAAALAGLLPITGNLYHHALEMLLKAGLSRTISIEDLKDSNKFGHRLSRIWRAFRADFQSRELDRFDATIADIDRWEELRYPERMLRTGAQISIDWGDTPSSSSSSAPPIYRANGTRIDELVIALFAILSKNTWAFYPYHQPFAREVVTRYHPMPERILGPTAKAD